MKFLDIPKLALLTAYLSSREVGDTVLTAKLEAFSCALASPLPFSPSHTPAPFPFAPHAANYVGMP